MKLERRATLVAVIARGRRWLDELIADSATDAQAIAQREHCSLRHVNMTLSLVFLSPTLVKAAVEGRLPRGIGVEQLRDLPIQWDRQFEALGLSPAWSAVCIPNAHPFMACIATWEPSLGTDQIWNVC